MQLTQEIRDMRVAVAKDVLSQLNLNRYKPSPGVYLEFDSNELPDVFQGELQQHLPNLLENPCNVCALGALFVSQVNLYDEFPASNLRLECSSESDEDCLSISPYELKENLNKIFDRDIKTRIENCFEVRREFFEDTYLSEMNPEARMRMIMENIIANNGEFTIQPQGGM